VYEASARTGDLIQEVFQELAEEILNNLTPQAITANE
jgi:hypothetical protein